MSQAASLVGSWKLVSIYKINMAGDMLYPYGEDPVGLLTYEPQGHMSVMLMRRGRSKFTSGDMYGGSPQEIKKAFEGFDAYYGTFSVNSDEGTVTHHLEASRFPNWEGTDQVRYFDVEDDTLSLFTSPIKARDDEWAYYLTWTRPSSTQLV